MPRTTGYRRGDVAPPNSRLASRPQVLADERALDAMEALQRFAAARHLSVVQVALGGLAAKPAIASVIAGASSPEHVRANALASDWMPTDADTAELESIASPAKYIPLGSRTGYLR